MPSWSVSPPPDCERGSLPTAAHCGRRRHRQPPLRSPVSGTFAPREPSIPLDWHCDYRNNAHAGDPDPGRFEPRRRSAGTAGDAARRGGSSAARRRRRPRSESASSLESVLLRGFQLMLPLRPRHRWGERVGVRRVFFPTCALLWNENHLALPTLTRGSPPSPPQKRGGKGPREMCPLRSI
jgi:hypothetical protein